MGPQSTLLNLGDVQGKRRFTLVEANDFASFDGNPRGINSSHSTGRRAANHGVVSHLRGAEKAPDFSTGSAQAEYRHAGDL